MALRSSHFSRFKTCKGDVEDVFVPASGIVWVGMALVQKPITGANHLPCPAHHLSDGKCPQCTGAQHKDELTLEVPKCSILLDARHFSPLSVLSYWSKNSGCTN